MADLTRTTHFRFWLWLITLIGVIVPRRLRADWRREWEAELQYRETQLTQWDKLDQRKKLALLWHSLGAFADALWMQPRRMEDEMFQDLRFGARMLLKSPAFTLVAILSLAIGIGANTALFSIVDTVLWRPLPYPHAERLVQVGEFSSPAEFVALSESNRVFDGLAAWSPRDFTLTGRGAPEQLRGQRVTPEFLPLLGVTPQAGRAFITEEFQPGRDQVAIIGHRLWRNRFGADPQIIGQAVTLDERRYTVVGVAPPQFDFFPSTDLLTPLAFTAKDLSLEQYYVLEVIARLKPGTPLERAQVELTEITRRSETVAEAEKPGGEIDVAVVSVEFVERPRRFESPVYGRVQPLHELRIKDFRLTLLALWGAVGFVLLIACANFANLMLARGANRQKEFAVRAAIGARRLRLVRQLLTESALVALMGGAIGLLFAYIGVQALLAANPVILPMMNLSAGMGVIPRLGEVTINSGVMTFAFALSLLTGALFGLAPGLQFSRPDLTHGLKEGAAVSAGGFGFRKRRRTQSLLVIGEIALALALLVGAGLLVRSFWRLQQEEPGFQPERLLTFQLELPWFKYRDKAMTTSFVMLLSERLAALPGVESVSAADSLPLSHTGGFSSIVIEGKSDLALKPGDLPFGALPPPSGGPLGTFKPSPMAFNSEVGPRYFRTMGIPLRQGREFDPHDNLKSLPVAVINEAMARRYWPGENPMGKRLKAADGPWRTVVGVVGNVKRFALEDQTPPEFYLPLLQPIEEMKRSQMIPTNLRVVDHIALVARVAGRPEDFVDAVRRTVWSLDPDQPILRLDTMEDRFAEVFAPRRFNMLLFGVFALVALLLAGAGIYGVMSYTVAQRTHEIGIRLALGAQTRDLLWLIVRQGLALTLIGVALGLGAALALTRVIRNLLYEVSATDPATFAGIALLLISVACVASFIPARRATKVDPLVALRHE